jgi:hypothetical protein
LTASIIGYKNINSGLGLEENQSTSAQASVIMKHIYSAEDCSKVAHGYICIIRKPLSQAHLGSINVSMMAASLES